MSCVEERLLSHPIARGVQRLLARVPQREGEHPIELVEEPIPPPDAEAVENDLRVAGRAEGDLARELGAQLDVVVDRAVEDEHVRAVRAHHRHVAARREVEDGEAARAERDAVVGPEAGVVGAAMDHRLA